MFQRNVLDELVAERCLSVQEHPCGHRIYNYTPRVQYERLWSPVTKACRGLILDENDAVVARPFPKFFNLAEHDPSDIPNEPFEVYDKMDGSLGILYFADGEPAIATRGAFFSTQAQEATKMLRTQYDGLADGLPRDRTYLFEIIYPSNRIVVNYGDRRELVLLAIIDNATGKDLPLKDIGFPVVARHHFVQDFRTITSRFSDGNREGFVVKFASGFRVKVKFDEYVRLHRLLTTCSTKSIWELMKTGTGIEEMLEHVPDEFYDWVRGVETNLRGKFSAIEEHCRRDFKVLGDRKETAMYFQTCRHPAILFLMLDGRDYSEAIWKLLRPEYERPFLVEV